MYLAEEIQNKWAPVLDHDALGSIKDQHRRSVTAIMLENTEKALRESAAHNGFQTLTEAPTASSPIHANFMGASSSTAGAGGIDTFDPVLISLVRRAMPNLMAYDICGVQPMTGPTGLIFAMKSKYSAMNGTEALFNEADTDFSGAASPAHDGSNPVDGTYTTGVGIPTVDAEQLGETGGTDFNEMAFSIEKTTVTAKTRALKAEYSVELAQDLKAVHGLDAEGELSNILSAEILAEINREVIRTINLTGKPGSQEGTTTAGVFDLDVDSNGRWLAEKFKGLMFQVEREANKIAKDTRRGKGNIVICSSDVASALQMAGVLDYAPALNSNALNVDDTGNTFAGVLNGRYRVYIDPYATGNYMTVGYKGSNTFDAGLFYCPYVPLQMVRAVDPDTFQPKIGFKTRYGMAPNPFAKGATEADANAALEVDSNVYYRKTAVTNIM